ncbi:hypothetical protein GECvBMG_gp182 [Salmonella phage GEC_vB_MG]|nr:hypothetical protein GECvBMG_gp182 [Salmonella phage GEC_vB_MG]
MQSLRILNLCVIDPSSYIKFATTMIKWRLIL